jgi:hypothetical protein
LSATPQVYIAPEYQPLLRHIGFTALWVFDSPMVAVWRKLDDRENCKVDTTWPDGSAIKLHIKRYPKSNARIAEDEARALHDLQQAGIPCPPLVANGRLEDGRAFVITADLTGYTPADKLIANGHPFENILIPTADLAARLHTAGFHHRDLYLCHFFARVHEGNVDIKLIDAARVRHLPGWPTKMRWIVKDLSQFWYSTTQLPITEDQRDRWLARYVASSRGTKLGSIGSLRAAIESKSRRIAAHDAKLNLRQPARHISIPK